VFNNCGISPPTFRHSKVELHAVYGDDSSYTGNDAKPEERRYCVSRTKELT